ncbi:TetR family transcriptional regulator [Nocardia sp. NPDC005978]|uniref:TetR/AcrR family transcriptional regulator n=1 Tax=Nocardia sp. NPDC005978 TaxID=3156725 RepID=UPI0033A27906
MTRPVRGTRPANRRELVLAAAAELFYRRGYSRVSMKDIAEAVAVSPAALYRHFRNKNELLEAVVTEGLTVVQRVLGDARGSALSDSAALLAEVMIERRAIGVLWHREARHLTGEARQEIRGTLRDIGRDLAEIVRRDRPELDAAQADFLAWAVLGVATSVSFHAVEVDPELLASLLRDTAATAIPAFDTRVSALPASSWSPSRRAEILAAATELFAARGFSDVGLDDIGAAIGIAGASLYNHFDSKAEILSAAIVRGGDLLRADMERELGRAHGPGDALGRLIASYREFAFENASLVRLLNSEVDQLPDEERHRARVAQHDYIATWMRILRQTGTESDDARARVRVQAALNTINDLATTPSVRQWVSAAPAVELVCHALVFAG